MNLQFVLLWICLAVDYSCQACVDVQLSSYCTAWKGAGYCKTSSQYYGYMKDNCKSTCDLCPIKPKVPPLNCKDKSSYCASYKLYCHHKDYESYLQNYCKRTCNFCHLTTTPPPTTKAVITEPYTVPGGAQALQPGCGKKGPGHTRIVGGKAAKPGDWPWQVNIDYKYNHANPGHHCGGTILTDEWILSAAHCFHDDQTKENYWLKLGEHDLKTDSGHEQRFTFAEMILHPKYNPTNHDFDLALIRLNKKTSNSDRVKAACLPDHNTTFPIGTKCYITGWGLLSEYGRGPQILQQAEVPLVDRSTCQQAFSHLGYKITHNMLCAGYASGGIDNCNGDSGGPLACRTPDDTWYIWGTISWGVGCARKNFYGVYANNKGMRPWIDSVVFRNQTQTY